MQIYNISVQKMFNAREHITVRFRVDFVNAFNHANFQAPSATITNSSFGTITSAYPARAIQFGTARILKVGPLPQCVVSKVAELV